MRSPLSPARAAACLAFAGWLLALPLIADEPLPRGEQVYRALCADCHGPAGEGTADNYPQPLIGDKSVLELADVIDKTMPEGEPEKCSAEDAREVAAYIHGAFYSPTAQARLKPARVDLSRLTVRQYEQSVADLIGSFRDKSQVGDERGLKGEYYKSRRFRDQDRALERVDPQVNFDFGEASPDAEKVDPVEFSIRWKGSVIAPETADYEFVVRTQHAARLWVNDRETPLIDAWVKSGDDNEYRGSIRLLGGRAYPLRLEFSKAKQGVDDSDKNKPKLVKASIVLAWQRPHHVVEPIPNHCLSPHEGPEGFVVATPFPPDDRSIGYERGTTISKAWDLATTDAAIETANYIVEHLRELSGAPEASADGKNYDERKQKLREFCERFVSRAFRRPLSDELRKLILDEQFAAAKDLDTAVKRVVLLALKSPRFLYRDLGASEAYDVAARISFGLWDSLPDQPLFDAAAAGKLATREQVFEQAERMSKDPRAKAKLRDFLFQWLRLDHLAELAKDEEQFPEFDEQLTSDLRTSIELFVADVVESEAADFRQLLLADALPLNGRLAKFYGADLPPDAPFQKLALEPEHRSGVLTHPYLLAGFAYTQSSSPIHRGVFISRSVLGRALRPPPEAITPLAPDLHADLTTRERVALQTETGTCKSCHNMINPLGFTLEHFDAVGRYRNEEQGKPIDASGSYLTRAGEAVRFDGVRDLAKFLASSEETHAAFVQQLFHNQVKQPVLAFGSQTLPNLRQSFEQHDFSIRKLTVEIIAATALSDAYDPQAPQTPRTP